MLLIDMLLKLSKNFSTKTNESSGLQICNNQSMIKMALTNSVLKQVQATGKEGSQEDEEGH
jgi:hypothetical protein